MEEGEALQQHQKAKRSQCLVQEPRVHILTLQGLHAAFWKQTEQNTWALKIIQLCRKLYSNAGLFNPQHRPLLHETAPIWAVCLAHIWSMLQVQRYMLARTLFWSRSHCKQAGAVIWMQGCGASALHETLHTREEDWNTSHFRCPHPSVSLTSWLQGEFSVYWSLKTGSSWLSEDKGDGEKNKYLHIFSPGPIILFPPSMLGWWQGRASSLSGGKKRPVEAMVFGPWAPLTQAFCSASSICLCLCIPLLICSHPLCARCSSCGV